MSASVGIVASFSRAVLASPECAWHHQNTAFTRLTDVSPRWLRRTALSCEWIGNTYLDNSGRDSPASLNSTGDMQPGVEWILKLLYQCT